MCMSSLLLIMLLSMHGSTMKLLPYLFYIQEVVKRLKYVINLNQLLSFQDPVLRDACLPSSQKSCICHFLVDCSKFNIRGFGGFFWPIVCIRVCEIWSAGLEVEEGGGCNTETIY
jgi:hypothetical protein